jgi:hypothetical protein
MSDGSAIVLSDLADKSRELGLASYLPAEISHRLCALIIHA